MNLLKRIVKRNKPLASILFRIYLQSLFLYREILTIGIAFLIKLVRKITIHKDITAMTITKDAAKLSFYGRTFYWNPDDRHSLLGIIFTGSYEHDEIATMLQFLKKDMTIFDIGSNYGLHTTLFADKAGPGGHVYGFEPVKPIYELLQNNISINNFNERITVENMGLSKKPGKTTIYISSGLGSGSSSLRKRWSGINVKQICTLTTLDDYVQKNRIKKVDFIKCDVEGGEFPIFQGGIKTLQKYKPILFFEAIDNHTKLFNYAIDDEIEFLKKLSYRFFVLDKTKLKEITGPFLNGNYYALTPTHLNEHRI